MINLILFMHLFKSRSDLVVYSTQDQPFFCWDCCVVTIEAPEIVEDGRGRTRRGVTCLLEELPLGGPGPASASLRMCLTSRNTRYLVIYGWKTLCFWSIFIYLYLTFLAAKIRVSTPRFNLQDLNSNGFLEESELIELNEFIAVLHYGTDFDRDLLEKKYRKIFRNLEHLDLAFASLSVIL